MPESNERTFVIFDGNHLIHRVWHTRSGQMLKTKAGVPSGLVHGFLSSFCSVIKQLQPEVTYVAWDHKSRHRRRILKQYRERLERLAGNDPQSSAARILDETPGQYKESRYKSRTNEDHRAFQEEMLPQMQELKDILPALGVNQLNVAEVEGDDLIGIASDILSQEDNARIFIISSDRDLYQLLDDRVVQYDPLSKTEKLFTKIAFKGQYGIEPIQWAEVKALMGDENDDIPGVPGCGDKTALKLIQEYGGVVEVIKACKDAPKSAVMRRIPEYEEQIKLAYELSYILSSPEQLDPDQRKEFADGFNEEPKIDWDEVTRFVDHYELKKVHQVLRSVLITNTIEAKLSSAKSVAEMFQLWGECTRCKLHECRNKLVRFSGKPRARLMFLGEGPGPSEDFYGEPFVGKAGKYLNEFLLAPIGVERKDVHVANIVCCFPNENGEIRPPDNEEIEACSPRLRAQVRLVNPKLIVLLGDKAYKAFFPDSGKISNDHGIPRYHPEWPGIVFVPVFHPSYLMRLQQGPQGHSDVVKSLNDWKLIRNLAETL